MGTMIERVYSSMDETVRAQIGAQFEAAGIHAPEDVHQLHDPKNVRKLVGRPLPSFITRPLIEKGLLKSHKGGDWDLYDGRPYLRQIADRQLVHSNHIMTAFLQGVEKDCVGRKDLVCNVLKHADLFRDEEKMVDECEWEGGVYKVYRDIFMEVVRSLARPNFDKKVEMLPEKPHRNFCVYYRLTYMDQLCSIVAIGMFRGDECTAVGGLMNYMDELFADDASRSFAFGAAITREFVWIFKFTPESFEPVASLRQPLDEGILSLAKLLCAPRPRLGLV